jgi:catalase
MLREKIFHFDHERIPERIVHARGSAAHGFFEFYKPLTNLTKADLFQRAGERTPVFVRSRPLLAAQKMIGRMVLDRWPDNFFAETEQAAYCPANIVPGVDFTNDPLLQGRLFSYLDTQKSRLGTANFHQIPINAPKCPVMNFQRDGMMQMLQPKGRANYEPNSLNDAGEITGPRECPATGFATFGKAESESDGGKMRIRAESFADHYSQARLFFRSLHEAEQAHLASALVFELSKVGLAHVRVRMMSNLVNVDPALAQRVANGLAMQLPKASPTATKVKNLDPSPALGIVEGPRQRTTLEGRAVGILLADGSDLADNSKRSRRSEGQASADLAQDRRRKAERR